MTTPDVTTAHQAALYNGTRWAFIQSATYDEHGAGYVGAVGRRLHDAIQQTYRDEAAAILADLQVVSEAMDPDEAGALARRLTDMARHVHQQYDRMLPIDGNDRRTPPEGTEAWTADYSQGGRPIVHDDAVPDAPVLEPVDGMTDDGLDTIDRADARRESAGDDTEVQE